MAARKTELGFVGLALLVLLIWWLMRDSSPAAALAADIATGKQIPIPDFGTDNIIDAADAISATTNLTHVGALSLPTNSTGF